MSTLSLAMIVKDEAAVLGRCLGSVRALVDEMVVVDTGSRDGTVALAESLGARVGHFPWRDDFAAARNESLRLCTGDWVLLLDADEALDPAALAAIRAAVAQDEVKAFTLVSRNYTRDGSACLFGRPVLANRSEQEEGAGLPFYADMPMLRLFRRLPGLAFEGRIHEILDPYFRRKKLPIGALNAVIHHYGKLDGAREKAKSAYYLELSEQDALDAPEDPDRQFNLMVQAELAGQWAKALEAGQAFARISARVPLAVRATMAVACQELGRHAEAAAQFREVLRAEPDHLPALCRLAISLEALGRGEEGRNSLDRAAAAHPESPMPFLVRCDLEERAGRPAQAREALRAAVERQPLDLRLRQALVDLDLRHQLIAQAAADAMEALRALPGQGGGQWHALAAGFLLKSGHDRPGRAVLDLGLSAFPEHEALRALAAALEREAGAPLKFNMGCGRDKRPGYVNVDQSPACGPDQVLDLELTPWPWPDGCAGEVVFNHSLEHLGGDPKVFLAIMREIYRICRDGAVVHIHVPHPRHDDFLGDPTHVRAISPQVMSLFSKAENDRWAAMGASNTPLAHYLGVDFELTSSTVELDEPYRTRLARGQLSEEQVQTALREKNNVATEYRMALKVRKAAG
jgi:tetratricopeptide (TPR) repeat protein